MIRIIIFTISQLHYYNNSPDPGEGTACNTGFFIVVGDGIGFRLVEEWSSRLNLVGLVLEFGLM